MLSKLYGSPGSLCLLPNQASREIRCLLNLNLGRCINQLNHQLSPSRHPLSMARWVSDLVNHFLGLDHYRLKPLSFPRPVKRLSSQAKYLPSLDRCYIKEDLQPSQARLSLKPCNCLLNNGNHLRTDRCHYSRDR